MCFYIFVMQKFQAWKQINTINLWLKSNSYNNISQYRTYLLTWCWDTTNNLPVVFWNEYSIKIEVSHAY